MHAGCIQVSATTYRLLVMEGEGASLQYTGGIEVKGKVGG